MKLGEIYRVDSIGSAGVSVNSIAYILVGTFVVVEPMDESDLKAPRFAMCHPFSFRFLLWRPKAPNGDWPHNFCYLHKDAELTKIGELES